MSTLSRQYVLVLAGAMVLMGGLSCPSVPLPPARNQASVPVPPARNTAFVYSKQERNPDPSVTQTETAQLVEGNTKFGCELYQRLIEPEPNLVFSPYSISVALAMAYAGAQGQTKTQMADVFHFTLPDAQLHAAINKITLQLAGPEESPEGFWTPYTLKTANSLWMDKKYTINRDFLDTIGANYGAGVGMADLVGNPSGSAGIMNDWISEATKGRITNMVDPQILKDLVLLIVNTIYFKAQWQEQFDKTSTQEEPFHLLSGTDVTVPMMKITHSFGYSEGEGWQAVSLPYKEWEISMTVILPTSDKFTAFESSLDDAVLKSILDGMEMRTVILSLPKFEFDTDLKLAETLKAMGMKNAFEEGFEPMLVNPPDSIFISDVLHRAFVAVDEEGTEAAAATVVPMAPGAAFPSGEEKPPVEFKADHPFIFLIMDQSTKSVLFMGRVMDPTDMGGI